MRHGLTTGLCWEGKNTSGTMAAASVARTLMTCNIGHEPVGDQDCHHSTRKSSPDCDMHVAIDVWARLVPWCSRSCQSRFWFSILHADCTNPMDRGNMLEGVKKLKGQYSSHVDLAHSLPCNLVEGVIPSPSINYRQLSYLYIS